MFEVIGISPEFSIDGKGILPNSMFDIKFKLIQFIGTSIILLGVYLVTKKKVSKKIPWLL